MTTAAVPTNAADAEHLAAQNALALCASVLCQHDYAEFIQRIERCHSVGPILDPTMYRAAMGRLDPLRDMAKAARALVDASLRLKAVIEKESA